MAENKKGFVLYADQIEIFEQLPDDDAGKLIKHIYRYVNDKNPVSDDLLLNVAFASIKSQLKRDLVKYEDRATRSKRNGKLGGRPKNPEEPKKPSGLNDNPEEPRKPDTVTVTDTVTDTVNDTVNDNKKKEEERKIISPFDSKNFNENWDLWKEYRSEQGKRKYKPIGEQGALTELSNLSNGDEKVALAIIMQTIKKGWTGFYNLKKYNNGNTDLQSTAANLAYKYLNEEQ